MGKVLQVADDLLDPVDAFAGFAHQVRMIVEDHFQRIHIQAQRLFRLQELFKAFRADTAAQPGDHFRQGGKVLFAAAQVGGDEGNRVVDLVGDARGNRAQ